MDGCAQCGLGIGMLFNIYSKIDMKAKSTQRQISKIYRYVLIFLLKLFYLGS